MDSTSHTCQTLGLRPYVENHPYSALWLSRCLIIPAVCCLYLRDYCFDRFALGWRGEVAPRDCSCPCYMHTSFKKPHFKKPLQNPGKYMVQFYARLLRAMSHWIKWGLLPDKPPDMNVSDCTHSALETYSSGSTWGMILKMNNPEHYFPTVYLRMSSRCNNGNFPSCARNNTITKQEERKRQAVQWEWSYWFNSHPTFLPKTGVPSSLQYNFFKSTV